MGRSSCFAAVLACACAAGSTRNDPPTTTIGVDDGSGGTAADDDGSDDPCVPGQQIECACPDGGPGAQACEPDGSGYGPCDCTRESEDGSSAAADTADASTGADTTGAEPSTGDTAIDPQVEACLHEAANVCEECECQNCAAEREACLADPGCVQIRTCAFENMCTGLDCIGPCGDVIDAHGGLNGESTQLAMMLSNCYQNACADC